MTYHEALWVAASAAAPVIALAAVATAPDATRAEWEARGAGLLSINGPLSHWASRANVCNIAVQAAVLLISLVSLATARNWTPVWIPIVLTVGGILSVAQTVLVTADRRMRLWIMELMAADQRDKGLPADPDDD